MSERWRSEPWMDQAAIIRGMGAHIDRLESALGVACQRLESWKAGELSAESALAHICGALGVAAPILKPLALVEDRTPEQLAADGDLDPENTQW